MKRVESDLITIFLDHVKNDYICGNENTGGPVMLERIVTALERILNGDDPDEALRIIRKAGPSPDGVLAVLALKIHEWRREKMKWAVVTIEANNWLSKHERKPVTERRLRAIYNQYLPLFKINDHIAKMERLTKQLHEQQKKRNKTPRISSASIA
jgi:hypothetical protein